MNALPPLLEAMGVRERKPPKPAPTGWADDAYKALQRFAVSGVVFKGEDVRRFAEAEGLPPAPDPRAWGGVISRASRDGRIWRVGVGKTANRQAHGRFVTIWQAR